MKIFRFNSDFKLFGFQDNIGDLPVLQTSLKQYQDQVAKKCGLTVESSQKNVENAEVSGLYFQANSLFTQEFLNAALSFIKTADLSKNYQFGIPLSENSIRFSLPTEKGSNTRKISFYYLAKPTKDFIYQELNGEEYHIRIPMPAQIVPPGKYTLDQNLVFAAEIISPFHLLQANMALNMSRVVPLQKRIPKRWRDWISQPNNYFSVLGLRMLNRKGKNCHIHPSAVVEGCILGDNVNIGANAVVRLSIIGSGTQISDSAVVTYSVIGERNYVSALNQLSFCQTFQDVFTIHGPYQFSIFGRYTAVFATINCDIRLDEKTISIETSNGVIDSQQYLLGIAYGHGSKVGASNIIASGRLVPNNTILNPPDFIHLKFPKSE